MPNLVDIIKKDFRPLGMIVKGVTVGLVQGAYTPFLFITGWKQFCKEYNKFLGSTDFLASYYHAPKSAAHFFSFGFTCIPSFLYADEYGLGEEYLLVLAISNAADYLVNAYRKSKKL